MGRFRSYLERNKVFFEVFSLIIIGASGIYISYLQNKISSRQYDLSIKQIQPLFRIDNEFAKSDTSNVNTTEYLTISNEGEAVKNYSDEITTLYKVQFNCFKCQKWSQTYYIPIYGYYWINTITGNHKGVLTQHYYRNNWYQFCKLYDEFLLRSKDAGPYFIDKLSLIKISYTDINDNKHVLYYQGDAVEGGYEVSEDYYNNILFKGDSLFKNKVIRAEDLTFDEIVKLTGYKE